MTHPLSRLLTITLIQLGTVVAFSSLPSKSRAYLNQRSNGSENHGGLKSTIESKKVETMPWTMNPEYGGYSMEKDWGWAFTSVPDDACSSYVCEDVEGKIPPDLIGTFYRNGPGKLERGGQRYQHVFDGDGFIASIQFLKNGQVKYTGRFVETEYFNQEQEKDEILYRNALGTERPGGVLANFLNVDLKNVANTNVIQFGNRLFAFWEAGRPYELDPGNLETLLEPGTIAPAPAGPGQGLGATGSALRGVTLDDGGPIDQKFQLARAFTAHPHFDRENNLFVGFRWAQHALRKDMRLEFVEYEEDWTIKRKNLYSIDGCNLAPHDFCIFPDYYCFFENRMEMDTLPFLLGLRGAALCMSQRLDLPSRVHLVPRNNNNQKKEAIQLDVPSFFSIHALSPGIETRDEVTGDTLLTVYSSGWDNRDERLFPNQQDKVPFLGAWGGPFPDFDIMPPSQLWRTVININNQEIHQHGVVIPDGVALEYPRVDERYPHVVYAPCSLIKPSGRCDPTTGFCQIDGATDKVQYWWAPPKMFCGELIPVPKRDKSGKELPDGGSWLLSLVHDSLRKRVTLVIMDSDRFQEGPVCWIHLKHTLTWGLHGSFTSC